MQGKSAGYPKVFRSLVRLDSSSSPNNAIGSSLFAHSATGETAFLRSIPQIVSGGCGTPAYGLRYAGLSGGSPDKTIAQMVNRYANDSESILPRRGLSIVGYSAGALIALGLAERLAQMGFTIGLLGLIDPPVPSMRDELPEDFNDLRLWRANQLNSLGLIPSAIQKELSATSYGRHHNASQLQSVVHFQRMLDSFAYICIAAKEFGWNFQTPANTCLFISSTSASAIDLPDGPKRGTLAHLTSDPHGLELQKIFPQTTRAYTYATGHLDLLKDPNLISDLAREIGLASSRPEWI